MPSIDVAVPCYQYGRYLADCLTSILSQDVANLRVLVIDNASSDNSVEIAQEFARNDRRVEVVARSSNQGATRSYNDCVDWAASDLFLLIDADDLLAPGALARAVRLFDSAPDVVMCYGAELRLPFLPGLPPDCGPAEAEADWTIQSGDAFVRGICRRTINHIGATTVVRRTEAQKRAGYYRAEIPYTDDLELWMRLGLLGDIASTSTIQAARRLHARQDTNSYMSNFVRDVRERARAFDSFFAHEGSNLHDARSLHRATRQRLAAIAYWSGLAHIARSERQAGLELLAYAIEERPSMLIVPPLGHLFTMENFGERLATTASALRQRKQQPFPANARRTS